MQLTPEEYAKELIEKFAPIMPNENWHDRAIQCALLYIEEIMRLYTNLEVIMYNDVHQYLLDTKKEIEAL